MKLKRIFPKGVTVEEDRDDDGNVTERREVFDECQVRVQHLSPVWHPSPRVIDKGLTEGWLSMGKGQLTLHTEDGDDDVVFDILAPPDRKQGRNYYDCKVVSNG